jgi:hypothetical protein
MIVQIMVTFLNNVGIPYMGGFRQTCKNLFSRVIAVAQDDDIGRKSLQGIIPDIVVILDYLNTNSPSTFQGRRTLIDVKMVSPGARYLQHAFVNQEVVNTRADEVNKEYYRSAKSLDRKFNGTVGDDVGPVQGLLSTYGHQGKVIGFGFGTFGECSRHVGQLIDLMVDVDAQRQAVGSNNAPSHFKSSSHRRFTTKLGHAIHRGWAKVLLERVSLLVEGTFFVDPLPVETNPSQ